MGVYVLVQGVYFYHFQILVFYDSLKGILLEYPTIFVIGPTINPNTNPNPNPNH